MKKFLFRHWMVVFASGWWLFWSCVQFYVMVSYGAPIFESILDSATTAVLLGLVGYVMTTAVKYFRPSAKNAFYILVESLVLAGLCCLLLLFILKKYSSNQEYGLMIGSTMKLRFVFVWLMILMTAVQGWVWAYVKDQQLQELRDKEAEKLMREAELSGLKQQIQPHFIFNSLNSISALAGTNPTLARKMIEQLSDFLRGTIKKDSHQLVSLRDEFRHLQLYLDIEKVRFGHRLETKVTADDRALEMKLPSLLLQPVLENAIKFGLYDTVGEVVITVTARVEQFNLVVEVQNPFDPASAKPKAGIGFGLNSIQRRLSLLFYRNDLLITQQNENIFTTTIKIPQQ